MYLHNSTQQDKEFQRQYQQDRKTHYGILISQKACYNKNAQGTDYSTLTLPDNNTQGCICTSRQGMGRRYQPNTAPAQSCPLGSTFQGDTEDTEGHYYSNSTPYYMTDTKIPQHTTQTTDTEQVR